MSPHTRQLVVTVRDHAGVSVVEPAGVLDMGTYAELRRRLLEVAAGEPRAIVVNIDGIEVTSPVSLGVFSTVWLRVAQWPGVPVLLVARDPARYGYLAARPVARYVPVHPSLDGAIAAVDSLPPRRRVRVELPGRPASSSAARAFVWATCQRWGIESACQDATAVVTELVENVLQHTGCEAELRLELRSGVLTVAVMDGSPRPAVLRESARGGLPSTGLGIVAALATTWGCVPTVGGKVVWAALRLPGRAAS